MTNRKAMVEAVKAQFMAQLMEALAQSGEDVGVTGSNEFNLPIVLEDGSEEFLVVKMVVPNGSRDGEVYDGYGARMDYQMKVEEKKAKMKEKAEEKAKKIARDEKRRASKSDIKYVK